MADSGEFRASPAIKINPFAAVAGTTVILLSLFASSNKSPVLWAGGAVILILGQIVQAWEAIKERRRGGILLTGGTLLRGGVAIALTNIARAERTRSGLAIILLDGKRVWIPAFVYAARDLDELRKRITAS